MPSLIKLSTFLWYLKLNLFFLPFKTLSAMRRSSSVSISIDSRVESPNDSNLPQKFPALFSIYDLINVSVRQIKNAHVWQWIGSKSCVLGWSLSKEKFKQND